MILELPIPPSPNAINARQPLHIHTIKRRYQRRCWAAAIQQERPMLEPPKRVVVRAHFRVHNLRDEADNLPTSLKWVLDALRQKQGGSVKWRQGLYDQCGYFVDDDPSHLTCEKPTQEIDRKRKGVTLAIIEVG